jgi:hypothetical protein
LTKIITSFAATLVGFSILGTFPASAADVRAELTPDLIYEHCLAAGVGSEAEGTFMLPGGRRVSGTVLCTAEDLAAAKAKPSRFSDDENGEDDDDDDDDDSYHENDDHDA